MEEIMFGVSNIQLVENDSLFNRKLKALAEHKARERAYMRARNHISSDNILEGRHETDRRPSETG